MTDTALRAALTSPLRHLVCHLLAALFACIVVAPPIVMLLDRREPVRIESGELSPNPARPGETITVTWSVTEFRDCEGSVHRRIIDSAGVIHETVSVPTVYHNALDRQSRTFKQTFVLPLGLHTGPAVYRPIVRRWCNKMQEWFWPLVGDPEPLQFEIIR